MNAERVREEETRGQRRDDLRKNRNFLMLWFGQTISLFGSEVSVLAFPLTAALVLGATPVQMGILGAAESAPFLLLSLFAGVWVDRLPRRPLLIAADVARAILLGLVPAAAMLGILRIEVLYVIGFLVGAYNMVFELAYASFLPSVVERAHLVEGNSKLQTSAAVAQLAGPGLAGGLVQLVTAPIAVLADAISFAVSGLLLTAVRVRESVRLTQETRRGMWREIGDGLRLLLAHPVLRAIVGCSATVNLFVDVHTAVYVLYLARELHIGPALLGVTFAVSSAGGLLGSLVAGPLVRRIGIGPALVVSQILAGLGASVIPLIGGPPLAALAVIIVGKAVWGLGVVVYVVNAVSVRQAIVPDRMLGRVTAGLRFITWGVGPFGFLAGGVLGQAIGLRATLVVAGLGVLGGAAWLILSPIRGFRRVPEAIEAEPVAAPAITTP